MNSCAVVELWALRQPAASPERTGWSVLLSRVGQDPGRSEASEEVLEIRVEVEAPVAVQFRPERDDRTVELAGLNPNDRSEVWRLRLSWVGCILRQRQMRSRFQIVLDVAPEDSA